MGTRIHIYYACVCLGDTTLYFMHHSGLALLCKQPLPFLVVVETEHHLVDLVADPEFETGVFINRNMYAIF